MSDYCRHKVIRMKAEGKDLGIKDIWDLEDIHKDLFNSTNPIYMEVAPTEEGFIDLVLEDTYGQYSSDFGFVRKLEDNEVKKYLPMFKEIYPDCTAEDLRYVDFCWYNCSEAPDYFEIEEV